MPALTRRVALTALLASAGLLPLVACQYKEPAPPPAYYPPQPQYYPPPPPQPAPWAPPQTNNPMPPSFGFFCATDNDLQCTYGLCRGGRCGGCTDASQCKRGSACQPSPVGMACFPSPQAPPQPTAPPVLPPSTPPGTPTAPPPVGSDPYARARDMCVARINQYRQQRGVAALAREAQGEPCADEESGLDSRSNTAHGSFGHCGERAQDACPGYPGPVEQGLMQCLDQMLAEGPGGGHYDNMMNAKYTRAFCGFAALSGGRFWMIQDFR